MREYRPATQSLKERIEIILTEEVNSVIPEHIDLFIIKASNRLLELYLDEMSYGKRVN